MAREPRAVRRAGPRGAGHRHENAERKVAQRDPSHSTASSLRLCLPFFTTISAAKRSRQTMPQVGKRRKKEFARGQSPIQIQSHLFEEQNRKRTAPWPVRHADVDDFVVVGCSTATWQLYPKTLCTEIEVCKESASLPRFFFCHPRSTVRFFPKNSQKLSVVCSTSHQFAET